MTEAGEQTDSRVEQVLDRLERIADQPVADHVPVFEAAHATLREVLDGSDPRPSA